MSAQTAQTAAAAPPTADGRLPAWATAALDFSPSVPPLHQLLCLADSAIATAAVAVCWGGSFPGLAALFAMLAMAGRAWLWEQHFQVRPRARAGRVLLLATGVAFAARHALRMYGSELLNEP